jgi:hypothetical protein
MPVYCYSCECGQFDKRFAPMSEAGVRPPCPKCSQPMERDYHSEHYGHVPGGTWPMTTTHLNSEGKPETFNSSAELERACKERGIRHRPDSAFSEARMEMEKYRTSDGRWDMRPVYREGRGDGEKGRRWI